jgi:asparagine synthase (glutamine-hydrolysing)
VSSRGERTVAGISPSDAGAVYSSSKRDVVVVVEGRLDETSVLRDELGLGSEVSIAALVAEAYLRWGEAVAAHLRGDYAFVIWDGSRERVVAGRDPFGIRPLHYAAAEGRLCFASEADQILAAGVTDAVPDDQMVLEFLTRNLLTLNLSFFKHIARVPPGHVLIATISELRTSDYRTLPTTALSFSSAEECNEAFRDRFFAAVRRRLSSEAPVVAQLSGGIDSTSIVCAANALLNAGVDRVAPVVAASAVYPSLDCDETTFIDAVERHIQIPVFRWDGTAANGAEFSQPLLSAPGSRMPWAGGTEGFIDIARAHGGKIILDGTGGDQLGMSLGADLDALRRYDLRATARYLFPEGLSWKYCVRVLRRLLVETSPDWPLKYYRRLNPRPVPEWLANGAAAQMRVEQAPTEKRSFISHGHKLRWKKLTGAATLLTSIEAKQRHASWSGFELAFPFLDWDLVAFTMAVHPKHWPVPSISSRFQREALRPDLPPEVYVRQSKADFTSAMTNRVAGNLDAISGLFERGPWLSERFVDRGRARNILKSFQQVTDVSAKTVFDLWSIASVEAWLRRISAYSKENLRS